MSYLLTYLIAVDRLRLVLNAEGYEYTDLASHGTGLRIVFHSHDDELPALPERVRSVMLSVGTHAHIDFRSTAVRRLQGKGGGLEGLDVSDTRMQVNNNN